jgi:putative ABC transport system ATP-binding protein
VTNSLTDADPLTDRKSLDSRPLGDEIIQLVNVNKTYKTGDEKLHVLNDVSLSIRSGEFIAIIGPSGSGKSTLANVIGGIDTFESGSVTVDGIPLAKARDRALSNYRNQKVGFVFQSFNLQGNHTALENVCMPLLFAGIRKKERRSRGEETLELVGLGDRMKHKATELSGGQRQRVAIARALVTKPSILIADEPTGNLDSARGVEIMGLLRELNERERITLIVVTHDMHIADQADRVLFMQDGVIREDYKSK